jgi:hypothetical protein
MSAVNQSEAADLSKRMADTVATYCTNVGLMPVAQRLQAFQAAAFEQIFEFLPGGAVAAVVPVPEADGAPMLVAVADGQFFKLNFIDIDMDSGGVPVTRCEKLPVGPNRGIVAAEVQYSATPTGQPARHTTWTFEFTDKIGLAVASVSNPERSDQEPNERFAQALASAMGWPELSPRGSS